MQLDDVRRVTVLGAGTMGHGIAELAALAGYEVSLRDVDEGIVREGYDRIEWSLGKLAEAGRVDDSEVDAALDRIEPLVDLEAAVDGADVVIEAVPERLPVKRDAYHGAIRHAPDRAAFATNTSALSITELSEATDRPERFCGMHFFNPPVRMDLVEVVAGAHTEASTLDLIEGLAEELGKTPIRIDRDSPGFVVNRVLIPLLNEAAWIVDSGDATMETVDSTTRHGIGLPMGSFELADRVGIDVSHRVLEYMHEELGEAYRPCPLLTEKLTADEIGRKSGRGFYDYDDGGAEIPTDAVDEAVRRRLLAVMANEVAGLIGGDVADADAIDRAMTLGAEFHEGPARLADAAGLDGLIATLDDLADATGETRYEAVATLRSIAESGGFHGDGGPASGDGVETAYETLSVTVDERVGHVQLDRPHRMNTIHETLLDELDDAIDRLGTDDDVRAILVTGAGDRAFSAGADVKSVAAGGADPVATVELSKRGQAVFGKLESSDEPVVAGIDGYCLGGGMELATCADLRIASERSEFGQPEHDFGLLPGWGGTQRLPRLVGEARAKEIIFTADRYDPETLREYGYLTEVVDADAFDDRIREFAAELAAGPPIAQAYTKRAIHAGRTDEQAGLAVENQAFGLLATTDDLAEGITAFASDRKPAFEGE